MRIHKTPSHEWCRKFGVMVDRYPGSVVLSVELWRFGVWTVLWGES